VVVVVMMMVRRESRNRFSSTFSRVDRDKVRARTIRCAPPSHANQPTFNLQLTIFRTTPSPPKWQPKNKPKS
jgi:hypothetical protein